MRGFQHPWPGRLFVAMAAWGALLALGESAAFATCGDYLAPMAGHDDASGGAQRAQLDGVLAPSSDRTPSAPCRGPHCRSNNKVPLAPTSPTIKIVVERWCIDRVFPLDWKASAAPLHIAAEHGRSLYLSEPPLRPPRAV